MTIDRLNNGAGITNSLQISKIGDIPVGAFNIKDTNEQLIPFVVKNITDDNITATITPYSQDTSVTTILYPGWNVELCKSIVVINANTLQYGY